MKKLLTVSLLAMMAVGTARADIASTSYADKVAGEAQAAAEATAATKANAAQAAAEATAASNLSTTIAKYSTTEQMNAAIKVETDRATAAEAALGTRIDGLTGDAGILSGLDLAAVAEAGKAIVSVSQENGQLAASAGTIGTAGIENGAVTKDKLSEAVQTSLGKADSAMQSIAAGSVTKDMLNTAVQTSLNKADSAMQSIAAGSVTKAMLDTTVQTSLGKADSAMQSIAAGSVTKDMLNTTVQASLNKADSAMQSIAAGSVTKAMLDTAVQTSLGKADAAAPQATTYTKTEVDAKISNVAVADAAAQEVTAPSIVYAQAMIDESQAALEDDVEALQGLVGETAVSTQISTAVNALANGAVATNTGNIGTLGNLTTTAKSNLVEAINEVEGTADAAMNFDELKNDTSWSTAKCGEANAVCSLVSKNGSIAWERVQP